MSCEFGEYADLTDETFRKARKPHKCHECRETIQPGQYYYRIASLYDGSWSHYNQCTQCGEAFEMLDSIGGCPGLGDMVSSIQNEWDWIPAVYQRYFRKIVPKMCPTEDMNKE